MEYATYEHQESRGWLHYTAWLEYLERRAGDRMQSVEDAIGLLQRLLEVYSKSFNTVLASVSSLLPY